jgi:hypothetical protein
MQQKWCLAFEIVLALLRIMGLAIGVWAGNFLLAVICYSLGTVLALLLQIVWMLLQVKRYDDGLKES